jgi:ATP-dependent Clp protease ATP-binding subunit ClpA
MRDKLLDESKRVFKPEFLNRCASGFLLFRRSPDKAAAMPDSEIVGFVESLA